MKLRCPNMLPCRMIRLRPRKSSDINEYGHCTRPRYPICSNILVASAGPHRIANIPRLSAMVLQRTPERFLWHCSSYSTNPTHRDVVELNVRGKMQMLQNSTSTNEALKESQELEVRRIRPTDVLLMSRLPSPLCLCFFHPRAKQTIGMPRLSMISCPCSFHSPRKANSRPVRQIPEGASCLFKPVVFPSQHLGCLRNGGGVFRWSLLLLGAELVGVTALALAAVGRTRGQTRVAWQVC
ncbi:hypothetical protein B0T17DRAFT_239251 [Bombardia bombarda]|uniref:Uncharacterized protein n=1 Tax=Bombardia bombarda TaxID=252184 RepID=A0AA40CA24_9PEZI|nr:hypothetical protein B0T17DRAFT_239251 [Bombardia bombarda]